VKRSGRDEPIWVVIHMCMEAMLGISLYSDLYLQQKHCVLLIIAMSSLQQNWRRGQNRFSLEARGFGGVGGDGGQGGEMVQTMYTHTNKLTKINKFIKNN
jgi:hypothetical protein